MIRMRLNLSTKKVIKKNFCWKESLLTDRLVIQYFELIFFIMLFLYFDQNGEI
jgi:hypothetical protein